MRKQSFFSWLGREVVSCRMALIGLYEQRDKLLYVEAPPLRRKYMALIGVHEEKVLEAELEVSMLRRKVELIQIAVNRREPIDLAAIDKIIEAEKAEKINALESEDLTLNEIPQLSEQEQRTLQRQYREITSRFHPEINTHITDTQKELYEKAQIAYKNQDVEQMKLIYDMLFHPVDLSEEEVKFERIEKEKIDETSLEEEFFHDYAAELSTDYKLAKRLYEFFLPLEEEAVIRSSIEEYKAQKEDAEREIIKIKAGFPFNAADTLKDENKTEEYLAELRVRARRCEEEKSELENKIQMLIGERTNG
ncbi:MAG: hypothetical protein IJL87_06875 [Clostridia bacterium]|nr:hypothetical protein [Clostridia bacterium]